MTHAPTPPIGDIDPDEFRRHGHDLIDWVADYFAHPERFPVLSRSQPGDIAAQLPMSAPEQSETLDAILHDFESIVLPGITHWNHPGFHAYFAISGSAPGVLGELLTAALNVNGMLWKTSPAATELETVTLDWLRQMLGLSDSFRGVITDTASMSTLLAIAAARENVPGLNIREQGLAGRPDVPRLCLYASEQVHSSIDKAAITLGIGQQGLRKIPTDREFRLDPNALRTAIAEDKAKGWLPFCVVATVGTTSTTSIDPVQAIAEICREHDCWLHVDGAYGGAAGIVPELRWVLDGCEHADSFVINPHKWLFTPIDCSVLYTRRADVLQQAFRLVPEYLVTGSDATNYMDWGVQLGRRFRALKLWMVMRAFGQEGLIANVREHVRLAQMLASWIEEASDWERMAPAPLSLVCLRARPVDMDDEAALEALNARLLHAVNASGEIYLSHTKLQGRYVLRFAIGNIRTTEAHIARAWEILCETLTELREPRG